jgi:hypothetical protein
MKNSTQTPIKATIARSKSIESSLRDGRFGAVGLAVVALHDLDERRHGERLGQEAGAVELAESRVRDGRGADHEDGW